MPRSEGEQVLRIITATFMAQVQIPAARKKVDKPLSQGDVLVLTSDPLQRSEARFRRIK